MEYILNEKKVFIDIIKISDEFEWDGIKKFISFSVSEECKFSLEVKKNKFEYVPISIRHWDRSTCPFCERYYNFLSVCPVIMKDLSRLSNLVLNEVKNDL